MCWNIHQYGLDERSFLLFFVPTVMTTFRLSICVSFLGYVCGGKFGLNYGASCFQEHREPTLYATDEYTGHNLPGGRLAISSHDQWLATAGRDGRLMFRQVETLVCCWSCTDCRLDP